MKTLEVSLINLFITAEKDDYIIFECDTYIFKLQQLASPLAQKECVNETRITTHLFIENFEANDVPNILNIIDNICLLLSFATQTFVYRKEYKIDSLSTDRMVHQYTINPPNPIIPLNRKAIREFIETTYTTFKKLKSTRQLIVIFGYLCEANRSTLALEIALISHYVAIENLKNTFALDNRYEYSGQHFTHKDFPPLDNPPTNVEDYWLPKGKRKKYVHKMYGQITSTEMTLRMFEASHFNRDEIMPFLEKRNKMIHEGILLPLGDENYMGQAIEDRRDVSDLLRKYLLTLLNYKGAYYLSRDRLGASGYIP